MRDVLLVGLKLTLITLIAAALLGVTNAVTEPTIVEQKEAAEIEAKLNVLPLADDFSDVDVADEYIQGNGIAKIIEVYQGTQAGNPVGYTLKIVTKGFGGDVTMIMGIRDGDTPLIEGVKILSHNETPGLGAKANEPGFINQYLQKGQEAIGVSKTSTEKQNEIQAITGATITSQAVTDGVNYALECYQSIATK